MYIKIIVLLMISTFLNLPSADAKPGLTMDKRIIVNMAGVEFQGDKLIELNEGNNGLVQNLEIEINLNNSKFIGNNIISLNNNIGSNIESEPAFQSTATPSEDTTLVIAETSAVTSTERPATTLLIDETTAVSTTKRPGTTLVIAETTAITTPKIIVTTSTIPSTTSAPTTTPPASCSESDGFFDVPESDNQCFKFYPDSGMTWEAAQAKCQEDGLVLAKLDDPDTAIAVRKFIVEKYGGNDRLAWVGARGTGSTLNWIRDDTSLSSSSSLWYTGQPGNYKSDSYCLELMGRESNMNSHPTKVYHMAGCTDTNKSPLCELIK